MNQHLFVGITITEQLESKRFIVGRPYPSPDHWHDMGHTREPQLTWRVADFVRQHGMRDPDHPGS